MKEELVVMVMIAVLSLGGAVCFKLAARMIFDERVSFADAWAVSAVAVLSAVSSGILLLESGFGAGTAAILPGIVFAVTSWSMSVLFVPFSRNGDRRPFGTAFLVTMGQCIGITVSGTALSVLTIAGALVVAAMP